MAGMVGTRVGSYEIIALLGKGGMGEVYRARDTRLKRSVAIKMLPEEFARDRDRVGRFQREAEVLASLNHANIATVHDLVEQDTSRFLVLELVEGDTLADRIAAGPISIDEALPIAKQICDALEAAHLRGVVHRDLKPGNIKILPDHSVKVLDFGLAKTVDAATGPNTELANSPTLTAGSFAGMILGTAAYMSPEQARGLPVDWRSDIFSFGCVLFEMLTGRRAFAGDTISDILAAVLKSEPDLALLPSTLDPRLRQLVQRTLAKPLKQRWQAIGDVRYEIEQIIAHPGQPMMRHPGGTRRAWAVAMLAVAVMGVSWIVFGGRHPTNGPALQLAVPLPEGMELGGGGPSAAISPDGTRIAFSARDASDASGLWIRALGSATAKRIEGTAASNDMFWSPDSRSLGFFSGGKLYTVNVDEGVPRALADAPSERGGTWSERDVILFTAQSGGPLMRIAAAGGTPVPLEHTASAEPVWPVFLPDGNRFLFYSLGDRALRVGWLDSDRIQPLAIKGSKAVYSSSGHLLFVEQGSLMAQRIDLPSLALEGTPMLVTDRVSHNPTMGSHAVTASNTGTLLHRAGLNSNIRQLTWFDRTGQQVGTIGKADTIYNFRTNVDQTRVVLDIGDAQTGKRDLWLVDDVTSGIPSRFTNDEGDALSPIFSPDGKFMLYLSSRKGQRNLHLTETSGSAVERPINNPFPSTVSDWSRDGRFLVQDVRNEATKFDIGIVPLTGDVPRSWFLQTPNNEGQARISPNGKWVAYLSDETGRAEIYVQSFPVPGYKRRISSDGGTWPRWRSDGTEVIYVAPNNVVTSVPVNSGDRFSAGAPRPLFRSPRAGGPVGIIDPFEVSVDGQRFLLAVSAPAPESISLILNWTSLLKE